MAKKLLCLLLTASMLFTLTSFSAAAQGMTEEEQMLQRLREFYADDPDVIDVVMLTDEDGEVYYSPVLAEEDVSYEELMAYLEPLGLAELHDRIATSANSTEESYEMYLDWVLSIESDLPENVFSYLYRETIALMEEASLMEGYSEEFKDPEMTPYGFYLLEDVKSVELTICSSPSHLYKDHPCDVHRIVTTFSGEIYYEPLAAAGYCNLVNHEPYMSNWKPHPSYHWRNCTSCGGNYEQKAHIFSYTNKTNHIHVQQCRDCGFSYGDMDCTYATAVKEIYPDSHKKQCILCKGLGAFPHEYGAWAQSTSSAHKHSCITCKFTQEEQHKYRSIIVNQIPVLECTVCGYRSADL